jgi:hypothetical protein
MTKLSKGQLACSARTSIKKKTEYKFCSENLLGLILAPNERWNRALHMRVERP